MRFLSLFLCSLIAANPIWARLDSADPAESPTDVPLHVRVVDDPGPAQPQSTSAKGYVLQVTNANGLPVSGAAVALRLPENGATGRFANGLRAWVAYSDTAGIARFPVIQWGETAGAVELKVTAAKGTSHAALMMAQRIGIDPASTSVVSVPFQRSVNPVPLPPPPVFRSAQTMAPVVADTLGIARRQVLSFNMPVQTEPTEVAVAPRPTPPQTPKVEVPASGGKVSQPLADVVPAPATQSATTITLPDGPPPPPPPPAEIDISHSGVSPESGKPHALVPDPPAQTKEASSEPTVTITNTSTGAGGSESHKKMWILIAVGAGAGAAALLGILAAHGAGGAGGGGAGSNSGVTVGAPTITVGH